jgi:hypothetical protein
MRFMMLMVLKGHDYSDLMAEPRPEALAAMMKYN